MFLFKTSILLLIAAYAMAEEEEKDGMFTKDQVFRLVRGSCETKHYFCPKDQYLAKIGPLRLFNKQAVVESKAFATFNSGSVGLDEFIDFFRAEFCCVQGECLQECGIYPVNEKGIIKNFPLLYKQIFALNISEINQYKDYYINYLAERLTGSREGPPAEVEEMFDYIHYNEDEIVDLLAKAQKQKQ